MNYEKQTKALKDLITSCNLFQYYALTLRLDVANPHH